MPHSPPTKPARMGVVSALSSSEAVVYVADLHREKEPGPGAYFPEPVSPRVKTATMGKTKRKTYVDDLVKSKQGIPGPGTHNITGDQGNCGGSFSLAQVPSQLDLDMARCASSQTMNILCNSARAF